MIEDVRGLRDQVLAEIGLHEEELARLQLLRTSLDAFIEQPAVDGAVQHDSGQVLGRGGTSRSAPPPASQAGAVRNGSRTSAHQAEERGFDSRPPLQHTTDATTPCPDCGKRVKPQGLGTHRRQAHSDRKTGRQPKTNGSDQNWTRLGQ